MPPVVLLMAFPVHAIDCSFGMLQCWAFPDILWHCQPVPAWVSNVSNYGVIHIDNIEVAMALKKPPSFLAVYSVDKPSNSLTDCLQLEIYMCTCMSCHLCNAMRWLDDHVICF